MALRLITTPIRRPRADSFPRDTPEPAAELDAAFNRLLSRARLWLCAFVTAAHVGLVLFLFFR
jgi:hypothetical protein